MAALYDLSGASTPVLALRTQKLIALGADGMLGQQLTAEMLLGLRAPAYSVPADVERIHLALVHQMNFQAAQGIDPLFMSAAASTHAKQSDVYRDRFISPIAAQIVAEVAAQYPTSDAAWGENLTSLRSHEDTGRWR
jgi:hypothetical protein